MVRKSTIGLRHKFGRRLCRWLFAMHKSNKGKDYIQGWYCIGVRHGPKYRFRRPLIESACEFITGHEISDTEWGWGGGERVDCHCRWCDKVFTVPVTEARFRFPCFNSFGMSYKDKFE